MPSAPPMKVSTRASMRNCSQDVTRAGADGLEQADFAGALGHADQHDVHDADSAHAEGERADDSQQRVKTDGEGLQHLSALDGVPFGSGFVVARLEVMTPADTFLAAMRAALCKSAEIGWKTMICGSLALVSLVENLVGDERLLVVGAFVHGVLDLDVHDADDFEAAPLDEDGLAHGGGP